MAEIRSLQGHKLSSLVLPGGDKNNAYKVVKLAITGINLFFGTIWTDYQLVEASKELYSMSYFWSINDLRAFVGRCRRLEYGQIYGQFSPQTLMQWAAKYNEEWFALSSDLSLSDHERQKYQAAKQADQIVHDRSKEAIELSRLIEQIRGDGA